MKKILVPCDFSKPAVNAFKFAISIAKKANATIDLLYVVELPVIMDPILVPVPNYEMSLKNDFRDYARKKFRSLIREYNDGRVTINTLVEFGPILNSILDTISNGRFDLVVMGSHGASGIKEYLFGSHTERVVRFSKAPVLVVKNFYLGLVKKIVFPHSRETELSDDFITKLKDLQRFFAAELHMVWINTPGTFEADATTHKYLKDFAEKNDFTNYTIRSFNEIEEMVGIVEFANTISADMIAMATHARKGIAHLLCGSLTEDVVNHAPNLVWTYVVNRSHVIERPIPAVKAEQE